MNFAILCGFKDTSGQRTEVVKELAALVRPKRIPDLNETTYYLSVANLENFYVLQLMYSLDAFSSIKKAPEELVYHKLKLAIELEKVLTFKLNWDYRRLDLALTFSTLSVVSFPPNYSHKRLTDELEVLKSHYRQFSGLVGIWVGYNFNPKAATRAGQKLLRLIRMDWTSQEAYIEFTNSAAIQTLLNRSNIYGTQYCYGIDQRLNIYRPDTLFESNKKDRQKTEPCQSEASLVIKAPALTPSR